MCSRLPGYNVVFPVRAFLPVTERAIDRSSERAIERARDQAIERLSDRSVDRSSDRSSRSSDRASDRAIERAIERASERSSDGASEQPSERSSERSSKRSSERSSKNIRSRNSSCRGPFEMPTCTFRPTFNAKLSETLVRFKCITKKTKAWKKVCAFGSRPTSSFQKS